MIATIPINSLYAQKAYKVTYKLVGKNSGLGQLLCTKKCSYYQEMDDPSLEIRQYQNEVPDFLKWVVPKVDDSNKKVKVYNDLIVLKLDLINQVLIYSENDLPSKYTVVDRFRPEWKLYDETKKIAKYSCNKASTKYHGRDFTVWYTNDIPISSGPWKLNGLNGLILEASTNDNLYQFRFISCVEITEDILKSEYKFKGPVLDYIDYVKKNKIFYQGLANSSYKQISSSILVKWKLAKISPAVINIENIEKELENKYVSALK